MMATGPKDLSKETIRSLVLRAGFSGARFLSPFAPPETAPPGYKEGSPSLLVAALPYGNQAGEDEGCGREAEGTAYIALFARRNYYREAVKRLKGLSRELRRLFGGVRSDFRILCNSPVPERPLALASGLGVPGRNGLIITGEAGSLAVIAAMTLPYALESDRARSALAAGQAFPLCGACEAMEELPCKAACPTGAMRGDGTVEVGRCIQWYASGKGESVPPEIAERWGNRLYGCTNCQDACVHNRRPIQGTASNEGPLPARLNCRELLAMDDRTLKAFFKGTAMGLSWLGPQAIRRNARLALGN